MEKITLSKKDRLSVAWRHQFLQGSWNYERMQNGGWCYSIIPAIKKLYPNKDDQIAALKRHMEFYNTHPYVSAPVMGVTLALEEELRYSGLPCVRFWERLVHPWHCPETSSDHCCSLWHGM